MNTTERCPICGGDAGRFPPEGHYLCQEMVKLGLPAPPPIKRCVRCNGTGHVGTAKAGPMLFLDLGPAAIRRSIEAVYPVCPECNGKGHHD